MESCSAVKCFFLISIDGVPWCPPGYLYKECFQCKLSLIKRPCSMWDIQCFVLFRNEPQDHNTEFYGNLLVCYTIEYSIDSLKFSCDLKWSIKFYCWSAHFFYPRSEGCASDIIFMSLWLQIILNRVKWFFSNSELL